MSEQTLDERVANATIDSGEIEIDGEIMDAPWQLRELINDLHSALKKAEAENAKLRKARAKILKPMAKCGHGHSILCNQQTFKVRHCNCGLSDLKHAVEDE